MVLDANSSLESSGFEDLSAKLNIEQSSVHACLLTAPAGRKKLREALEWKTQISFDRIEQNRLLGE